MIFVSGFSMPKLCCMAYRPQNKSQIYDFFPINKEVGVFYHPFRPIFLEMSKQFFKFVGCKLYFGDDRRA